MFDRFFFQRNNGRVLIVLSRNWKRGFVRRSNLGALERGVGENGRREVRVSSASFPPSFIRRNVHIRSIR